MDGNLSISPALGFQPNATSLQAAFANNSLGASFSGSGFLIVFFAGVGAVLKQLGILTNATRVAGASGGSITAAALCSGISSQQFLATNLDIAARCRPTFGCRATITGPNNSLNSAVRSALGDVLPADAAQRCRDKLFVAVTEATPHNATDRALLLGPNWRDRQQIVDAVATSSYIPVQSGPLVTSALHPVGIPAAYDGGFTDSNPTPPGVSYTLTVAATPPPEQQQPATANGSAAANASDAGAPELVTMLNALVASSNATSRNASSNITGYLPLNPVPVPRSPRRADVYPGLGGKLRVPPQLWNSWALAIPNDTVLLYIYDTGRADAAAFARASGLAAPAAVQEALRATAAPRDITAAAAAAERPAGGGSTSSSSSADGANGTATRRAGGGGGVNSNSSSGGSSVSA